MDVSNIMIQYGTKLTSQKVVNIEVNIKRRKINYILQRISNISCRVVNFEICYSCWHFLSCRYFKSMKLSDNRMYQYTEATYIHFLKAGVNVIPMWYIDTVSLVIQALNVFNLWNVLSFSCFQSRMQGHSNVVASNPHSLWSQCRFWTWFCYVFLHLLVRR
jgi:hypothetical protein